MSASTIVVIDKDQFRRQELKNILEFIDCESVQLSDCENWRNSIDAADSVHAIFVGDCGSDASLNDTVRAITEWDAHTPIILMIRTEQESEPPRELAKSIFHMMRWPIKYQQLNDLLQQVEIYYDGQRSAKGGRSAELFRSLVGNSRKIREVRAQIEQVAKSDANVLILGESGTGKEVVARNLHYYSSRRNKPFVPINCGAIPADLLESELFGHEKGAFTGALSSRRGRFEMAESGTLFLDEIGDMSMHMQVKLLRVLQERTFERVGSNKTITADVRIIAATHRNLEKAIESGEFREDLYYRLNVFPIEMPPLRERIEDIPLLIHELITRLEHEKRSSVRLTQGVVMALCQYHWPGNVRELANLVERLIIMYPFGVVDVQDLPEKFRANIGDLPLQNFQEQIDTPTPVYESNAGTRLPREGIDLKKHLSELESSLIQQALDDAGGVVAHAANRLKLRRTTLVEKLRKYGIQRVEDTP